jgi:hypothetical protein
MEIDKTISIAATMNYAAQQKSGSQANTKSNEQSPAVETAKQGTTQASDQIRLTTPPASLKSMDTAKAIDQMHAAMNQLAAGVGKTNEELKKATVRVGQMATIIKNYPPYTVDSEHRKEILMSYASIREEIIKMTVPPPPPPVYEKVKGMWSTLFEQNGQILHHAVPALHATSSDWEVQAAATNLDNTGGKLADLSSGVTQALIPS